MGGGSCVCSRPGRRCLRRVPKGVRVPGHKTPIARPVAAPASLLPGGGMVFQLCFVLDSREGKKKKKVIYDKKYHLNR